MKKLLIPLLLFISFSVSAQYTPLLPRDTTSLVATKTNLLTKADTSSISQTADYVIEKVGSTIYARPGFKSGLPLYSGSNLATVFNQAISALTTGGSIYVRKSVVDSVTTPIVDAGYDNVELNFEKGSRLIAKKNLNNNVIAITSVSHWRINGVEINGNRANQSSRSGDPSGIMFQNCTDLIVSNAYIYECYEFGVYATGSNEACTIKDSYVTGCDWNCITVYDVTSTSGTSVINCDISHFSDVGITTYGNRCIIEGNHVHDADGTTGSNNNHWGIGVEWQSSYIGSYNTVSNNMISGVGLGIQLSTGCNNNTVSGNIITGGTLGSLGGAIGIFGPNNHVINNTIYSTSSNVAGILDQASDNIIQNNHIEAVIGIRVGDWAGLGVNRSLIESNRIKSSTVAVRIASSASGNTKIMNNDMDSSSTVMDDAGTGTIYGPNIWSDGTYHLATAAASTAFVQQSAGRLLAYNNVQSSAGADTNEDTLYAVTIPASSIGVNGSLHIIPLFSNNNSAGTKTFRIRINGTQIANEQYTTTVAVRWYLILSNRNSASSQISGGVGSAAAEGFASSSGTPVATYSFNTASSMRITVTAQKNTAGDVASLESFQIIGYY